MAARAQFEEMRRRALPPGVGGFPGGPGGPGGAGEDPTGPGSNTGQYL
jgi:hypothetical protein